eukprot:9182047-Pyramimonas_sp.AAC.1
MGPSIGASPCSASAPPLSSTFRPPHAGPTGIAKRATTHSSSYDNAHFYANDYMPKRTHRLTRRSCRT